MSKRWGRRLLLAAAGLLMGATGALTVTARTQPASPPLQTDTRASVPPRDLDTPRAFPKIGSRAAWDARRADIRQQMRVSFGLYPMPPKTPLKARVFDRVERDGYTIEKVTLQTYPGFYLAGNLYRPFPQKPGRIPGVLVAHGHWGVGRMANYPEGSIAARAITFARQGCAAFTYDMVGYNDTRQIDHRFANSRQRWLWGVTLMGLQTWNSIRALDFLVSLREVDAKRLAITGESGGGTQTMMLGALDDRLAAVAPCVMVSHTMQGGCLCENAPGLRIDYSNMEIAAVAAPKPQILVAATGDWTKTTLEVEGPAIASVYALYGRRDNLDAARFDYGHNINKTSREAVYAFFGKHLLGEKDAERFKEPPYTMEPVDSLRVFPADAPLPPDAKNAEQLTDFLIAQGRAEVERRKPRDRRSLTLFKKTFLPAWKHTLAAEMPESVWIAPASPESVPGGTVTPVTFGRPERGDSIPGLLYAPESGKSQEAVILAHPQGKAAFTDSPGSRKPGALAAALLAQGKSVLLLDAFLTGARADAKAQEARKPFEKYFTVYNRTDLQERVQDLMTACRVLREQGFRSVALCGMERAGLWALLAAPAADAVAADCARLDLTTDDALLEDDLFTPGLRRFGDFHAAATLAAPNPLLLHNTGRNFLSADWIQDVYRATGNEDRLRREESALDARALSAWLNAIHGAKRRR